MIIRMAQSNEIDRITEISKAAFDTDIQVGNTELGGPPDYDNIDFHRQMLKEKHLFSVYHDDQLIGGAIVFEHKKEKVMYIGRIFIDPKFHRNGYGKQMMNMLEEEFKDCVYWRLETPEWNIRTNAFYKKLGYEEMERANGSVYYQKQIQ